MGAARLPPHPQQAEDWLVTSGGGLHNAVLEFLRKCCCSTANRLGKSAEIAQFSFGQHKAPSIRPSTLAASQFNTKSSGFQSRLARRGRGRDDHR